MKKLSFLLLTIAAFSLILASCAPKSAVKNKDVSLRLNLNEGTSYDVQTHMIQDMTTHVAGRDVTTHMNMAETIHMKAAKNYQQDSLLLHVSFKHISANTSAMGHKMSFDSDSSRQANNNKFSDLFNKIKNSSFTIKLTPLGKVLNIKGLKHLKEVVNNTSSITNPAMKKMFKNMFNKQKVKNGFFNIGIYPKQPITEGFQWDNKKTIPSKLPLSIHLTYTVKKIQPDSVFLDVKGRLSSSKDSLTIRGMKVPVQASGTQTGTYTINRSTGLISSGKINQDITMTMSMMGRNLKIGMKGKTTIATEPAK